MADEPAKPAAERQRGTAVPTGAETSSWSGRSRANPEYRGREGESELTGQSGDSVRTEGVESATSASLGAAGAGATTTQESGPKPLTRDEHLKKN